MFFFLALFIFWLVYFVPPDSDEFLAYYNIACKKFEGSRLAYISGYDIGCENFKLKFFGYEYTKSYSYLGLSSALLYSPFYLASPNIESHYIYGLFFLILFSFFLTKSLDLKWQISLLPLLYFPLCFLFLHDTGPIKIAMFTLPILIIIFKRILSSNSLSFFNFFLVFLASTSIIIALEDKSFYLFLLPSFITAAFLIALKDEKNKTIFLKINTKYLDIKFPKNILILAAFFLTTILIAIFLLFVLTTKYVQRFDFDVPYIGYLYAISPKISFFEQLNYLLLYTLVPIAHADRIFELENSLINTKNLFSLLSFLPIVLIMRHYIKQNTKIFKTILFTPIIILIIIFLILRNTWSGHHFIFLHLFFLPLIMYYANANPKNFLRTSCALIICTLVSIGILSSTKTNIRSSKDISEISSYLNDKNIASKSIINFSSWGGYMQQSIYGDSSQIVTMTAPINADLALKLENLRIKKNRIYILNICYNCSVENIKQVFVSAKNIETVGPKTNDWKLIKISYD